MDPLRFDSLVKSLSLARNRRGLVRLLATVPFVVALTIVLEKHDASAEDDDHGSSGRRHRRKARHRHQTGNNKEHRKGKRKGRRKDKGKKRCTKHTCPPGDCFSQSDGRGGTLSCGCAANQLCDGGTCQTCTVLCPGGTCDGAELQGKLALGGTVYACAGTYTGHFSMPMDVTLVGAGQGTNPQVDTILDGQDTGRVLIIPADRTTTLRQVRLIHGLAAKGGGIQHLGTTLTMTDCTVANNHGAPDSPAGGIFNEGSSGHFSTLIMTRCTVRDNHTAGFNSQGGGLLNEGSLTMTDCRIEQNSTQDNAGGGLFNDGGEVQLTDCTVTLNSAPNGNGGGIFRNGGTVTLTNTVVTNNTGGNCAGGPVMGCTG